MNRVELVGRAGKDAELKQTANGTSMARFSVATSEKHGEKVETFWHDVIVFGKFAEMIAPQIFKGSEVLVIGKMQPRQYVDANGIKKYSNSIVGSLIRVCQERDRNEDNYGNMVNEEEFPV